MNLKDIFESDETEWSVQGYIDEKELHDSIVDINKQNQNAVNEQLLNGKYDGITGEPVDVSTKRYVDIDAVLKDQERLSGDLETERYVSGNGDRNRSYQSNQFSKDGSIAGSYSQGNSGADAHIGSFGQNRSVPFSAVNTDPAPVDFSAENRMSREFSNAKGFEVAGKALNIANREVDLVLNSSMGKYDANDPNVPLDFSAENRISKGFSGAKGFEAAGKELNMANRAADLALNSSTGKYDGNDATTPYMAEYDVAEKVLDLAGRGSKTMVKGVPFVGHAIKTGSEKLFSTNVTYEQLEDTYPTAYLTVNDDVQCVNDDDFVATHEDVIQEDAVFETVEIQDASDMNISPDVPVISYNDFQSIFGGDDGSIDGLIEQLGIVSENEMVTANFDSESSANMLLISENQPELENNMGLMVISDSNMEDLSEKLGIVSENEIIHESGVMQIFESVADNHGVIVPDSENLSDTNLVLLDGNHALFDRDSDAMQHDLEQKLGIYNKKSKRGKLGDGLKNNIKNREKALARERFKFMVSVLINENKGGPTTDSGLGQIIFGGAARRVGGIAGYLGKKVIESLLPYAAAGLVALVLFLGGFLLIAGVITFPLFTVMNVSSGAGRELTVMNQDFDYPSSQDYIYTRAVSLYEDFCYEREDIVATYDDGLNEFVYDSNTATDYLSNSFSLIWAYLTTVDDEGIDNNDDLIVAYPSDSFNVMQRVSKEMFYYVKETIYKTNSSGQRVRAYRFTFVEKNYIQWFTDKFLAPVEGVQTKTPSHAAQNEYDLIISLTDGATPGSLQGVNLGDGTPPDAYDDALVAAIFAEGEKYLGVPYRLKPLPTPPTTFCCDIFVKYVFKNVGIAFPPDTYTAQGLYNVCAPVSPSEAKAGDLIFFSGTYSNGRTVTHVGIYCGNGVMLHSGDPVKYSNVNTPYWQDHFYGFGRYGVNN